VSNSKWIKILNDYEAHCKRVLKSTIVDTKETPSAKRKRIADLEKEYTTWFEYYLSHYAKSKCSWYHKRLAKYLINNLIIYIVLRVFRGGAKSVHINIGIPLYLYLVKNDMKFMLLVGENETKAKKLISDIQAELQFNNKIAHDYGNRFKFGNWADGNFTTIDGVHFFALGIGQSPRGVREMENRPDYIVVDDVDTKKRAKNPKLVNELFEYLKEDIFGTFGKERRRYVQANNRFSKNSCIQLMSNHFEQIKEQSKQLGLSLYHHIIVAKAIMNSGKSGWPENYTLQDWEKIRIERGERSFQREYMDNPIEEGTVFKNDWIQFKQRLPLHQYDALTLYGDLSYKEQGDYKALILVGKTGREYHIIKAFVRKSTRALAAQWLYDVYEDMKLSKYNIRYKIEGLFAQDEFVNDFDQEGDKRGYHIPVVADKKPKSNKHERIESMSGYFERLNVFFNTTEKDSADFNQLIEQILGFEKGSSINDDAPDALQSAIADLNSARMFTKDNTRITSRKDRIHKKRY